MTDLTRKIKELLQESNTKYKTTNRSFVIRCPVCAKDAHCYIEKETGNTKCFKCEWKTDLVGLIVKLLCISFDRAKEICGIRPTVRTDSLSYRLDEKAQFKFKEHTMLPEVQMPLNFFRVTKEFPEALQYFSSRQTEEYQLVKYKIMYSPMTQRIIIPVYMDGRLLGWQGRDITGTAEIKIKTEGKLEKTYALMGFDTVIAEKHPNLALVEGPFDMLSVERLSQEHQIGCIATMGKGVSKQQIELIRMMNWVKKLYIGLDPDAFYETRIMIKEFLGNKITHVLFPPLGIKDLGDCTKNNIAWAIENAKYYSTPTDYICGGLN